MIPSEDTNKGDALILLYFRSVTTPFGTGCINSQKRGERCAKAILRGIFQGNEGGRCYRGHTLIISDDWALRLLCDYRNNSSYGVRRLIIREINKPTDILRPSLHINFLLTYFILNSLILSKLNKGYIELLCKGGRMRFVPKELRSIAE